MRPATPSVLKLSVRNANNSQQQKADKEKRRNNHPPDTYRGQYRKNLRHGQGTYVYSNPFFSYSGDWVDGVKHGQGRFLMGSEENCYEGEFKDGEITGFGKRKWDNGNTYEGNFLNGTLHGRGVFRKWDGEKYDGEFQFNRKHGEGEITYSNGDVFKGNFENNRRVSKGSNGIYITKQGDRYQGEFNDKYEKHGNGVYEESDGSIYEGEFQNGKRHGKGRAKCEKTGVHFEGKWKNGNPVGGSERLRSNVSDLGEISVGSYFAQDVEVCCEGQIPKTKQPDEKMEELENAVEENEEESEEKVSKEWGTVEAESGRQIVMHVISSDGDEHLPYFVNDSFNLSVRTTKGKATFEKEKIQISKNVPPGRYRFVVTDATQSCPGTNAVKQSPPLYISFEVVATEEEEVENAKTEE
eukprot:g215.t1